jgi:hypothetical protein
MSCGFCFILLGIVEARKGALKRPYQSLAPRHRRGLLEAAHQQRTLARRMQSVLSVDQIASEVGYAEGVTLRALLRRRLGRGVREIRRSL